MPLMAAQNGHGPMSDLSPLSGVKRKSNFGTVRSVDDPERTSGPAAPHGFGFNQGLLEMFFGRVLVTGLYLRSAHAGRLDNDLRLSSVLYTFWSLYLLAFVYFPEG